jgi:hypothetical protein
MRILTIIVCLILAFSFIQFSTKIANADSDCSRYIEMVRMSIGSLPAEEGFRIACRSSAYECKEYVGLAREGVVMARHGVQLLKKEPSCRKEDSLKSIIAEFENEIEERKKIIDKYDLP